jgi:hypothetical protein
MSYFDGLRVNSKLRRDPNLRMFAEYAKWHDIPVQDLIRRYPKAKCAKEIAMYEIDRITNTVQQMVLQGEIVWKYNLGGDGKTIQETSCDKITEKILHLAESAVSATNETSATNPSANNLQLETEEKVDMHLEDGFGIEKNSEAHNLISYWIDLNRFLHDTNNGT